MGKGRESRLPLSSLNVRWYRNLEFGRRRSLACQVPALGLVKFAGWGGLPPGLSLDFPVEPRRTLVEAKWRVGKRGRVPGLVATC